MHRRRRRRRASGPEAVGPDAIAREVEIGPERADEAAAIGAVHCAAFNDTYEAAVVAGLRDGG